MRESLSASLLGLHPTSFQDMRLLPAFMALAAISATASAQVRIQSGTSANTTTTLDFDTPFVASGPITSTDPALEPPLLRSHATRATPRALLA